MVGLVQDLDDGPRQPQLALDGLVAVGGRADGDHPGFVALLPQLAPQDFADVSLGDDLRFEVQAGRHVQVAVRRSRVAVDAAHSYVCWKSAPRQARTSFFEVLSWADQGFFS